MGERDAEDGMGEIADKMAEALRPLVTGEPLVIALSDKWREANAAYTSARATLAAYDASKGKTG